MNKPPFPRHEVRWKRRLLFIPKAARPTRSAAVHSGPQRPLVHIGIAQHHGGGRTVLRVLHIIGGKAAHARRPAPPPPPAPVPSCRCALRPAGAARCGCPAPPRHPGRKRRTAPPAARCPGGRGRRCAGGSDAARNAPSSIKRHSVCCSNRDTVEEYTIIRHGTSPAQAPAAPYADARTARHALGKGAHIDHPPRLVQPLQRWNGPGVVTESLS